jgi:hypothetical protein
MAPGPVAAAGTCNFTGLTGGAATGIGEFQFGRAGIPVAGRTRNFLVLFTAGAGVQGCGFVLVVGFLGIFVFWLGIFWHSFTNRTVAVRYLLICA